MTEPLPDRRGLLLSGFALALNFGVVASGAAATAGAPLAPRVLFICQYGTAKSAIAREVFRQRAQARGIPVFAYSRGITPAEHISPTLRTRLLADGIDPAREPVQTLAQADIKSADIVVTFNPVPKTLRARRTLDWSSLPSMNDAYPRARADLLVRVDALLDRIRTERRDQTAASNGKSS